VIKFVGCSIYGYGLIANANSGFMFVRREVEYLKIKNINGTAERIPQGYSSWHDFWEKKTGRRASHDVGGHVKKVDSSDNSWYIADLTYAQNKLTVPYEYTGELAKLRD
jgi:hypothetical protein